MGVGPDSCGKGKSVLLFRVRAEVEIRVIGNAFNFIKLMWKVVIYQSIVKKNLLLQHFCLHSFLSFYTVRWTLPIFSGTFGDILEGALSIYARKEPSLLRSFAFGGAACALDMIVWKHALDRIKVHSEARGTTASVVRAAQEIFLQGGMGAFYKGLRWNLALAFFKGSCGWMVNNIAHRFVSLFVKKPEEGFCAYSFSVGVVTGGMGAFMITPIERLKILEMTSTRPSLSIGQCFRRHGPSFFFVGLSSVALRQSVTWAGSLYFYRRYKALAKEYTSRQSLLFVHKVGISLLTGASVCFVDAPIDFYKTHKQMLSSLHKKSPAKNIKTLVSRYGVVGFYCNMRVKMVQSCFSYAVTLSVLDLTNTLPTSMS